MRFGDPALCDLAVPILAAGLALAAVACSKADEQNGPAAKKSQASGSSSGSGSVPANDDLDTVDSAAILLVAMDCDVVNAGDTNATETTFGCTLRDEYGQAVTEPVEPVGAKVADKSNSLSVDAKITAQPLGSAYQFAFVAGGVKPSAASSVTFTAVYRGKKQEFIFLVPPSYLTKTNAELELFVDGASGDDANLCQKGAPCKTVGRALTLLPEVIGHRVLVRIAASAFYVEDVVLRNKSIAGGSLTIQGNTPAFDAKAIATISGKVQTFAVSNVKGPSGSVRLESLGLSLPVALGDPGSPFHAALDVEDSDLMLADVILTGPSDMAKELAALASEPEFDARRALSLGGLGARLLPGAKLRLEGVAFANFGTAISSVSSAASITGAVLIEDCAQGIVGEDGAALVAIAVIDGPEAYSIVIRRAQYGIVLNSASSFAMFSPAVTDLSLSGLPKAAGSAAISLLSSSRILGLNLVATKITIADFDVGLLLTNSSTIDLSIPRGSFSVTGCTGACINMSSSSANIDVETLLLRHNGVEGALFDMSRRSSAYLGYRKLADIDVETDRPREAPLAAVLLDQSLLTFRSQDSAAKLLFPLGAGTDFGLWRGSQLLIDSTEGVSGIVAAPHGSCQESWTALSTEASLTDGCARLE